MVDRHSKTNRKADSLRQKKISDQKQTLRYGGGETETLIRSMDWSATPLGSRDGWPESLRTVVNLILASSFPMAILWGSDLILVYNDAYRVIAADRHPGAMGRSTREVWPEVWEFNKPVFERVMAEGETVHFEDQLYRIARNGRMEDAYFTLSYSPIRSATGQVMGALVVLVETTQQICAERELEASHKDLEKKVQERTAELQAEVAERKRMEEETQRLLATVQEEKDRLSAVVNSIQDEVWFADTDRNFTLANPSALREFRFGAVDRIDVEKMAASLEVYRPDGTPRPVDEAPPLLALKGEKVRNQEEIIRTPASDELRYREVSSAPVRDARGSIVGSVSVVRDITERKRAEETISRSQKTFSELVERAPFGIYIVDSQFRIAQMNLGSQNGTFRNVRPLIGRDFAETMRILWPEPVAAEIIASFRHTLESGEPYYSPSFVNPRHDVEIVEAYEWELHRMKLPDGQYGVVCYYFDSTKLRVAEEALRKARDELELHVQERTAELQTAYASLEKEMAERKVMEEQLRQSQKMEAIGTLAGGIAHDFNNILAAILGFTEMATEDAADRPEVGRSLQNILKAAMRARDLVKQILAFSRKTNYEKVPLSLAPLMKDTVQLLRASIPTTIEIRLTHTASSDTVLASPVEVQQVLMNLGTNASLAMQDKGGTLEISLADVDFAPDSPILGPDAIPREYLQLTVKDTGVGMAPEVMKRVFEPFFTTRGVGKGTGMGLAVVYGIVKDLQGAVTVESEPGAGSTFRVFLPKLEAKVEKAHMSVAETLRGTERVLFIDDEQMLTEWGQAVLERLGYSVVTLTDSTEALMIFASNPSRFDLVVTDQTMPGMTGVHLSKELQRIRPDIPIILCTGHSAMVSADTAKEAGIREFLMKPVTKQELAAAIRRVLDANKENGSTS